MTGALAVSRLQDVEAIFFHGELEVLHVLEVTFENAADFHQLLVRCGHLFRQIIDRMRRAHTGNDVFTLGVDQVFAVENFFAGRWIPCKCNPRCARLSHVPEHHCLNVHRRSPIMRDSVFPPIHNRAIVHPRAENRSDCAPKLFFRILRERFSGALLDQCLEPLHELLQIGDG